MFDKAITQSGGCSMRQLGIDPAGGDTIWPSRQDGERIAAAVAEPVACTDATRTMPCLRRVPTSRLLAAQQKVPATWAPSYGTDTLPQEPGSSLRTAFGRAAKRLSARDPAGAELSYLFDDWEPPSTPVPHPASYWTNFAAMGNPNGPGLPRWKPLTSTSANDVHTLTLDGRDGDVAAQHHCRYWATHS